MSVEAHEGEDGLVEDVGTILWDLDWEIVCYVHFTVLGFYFDSLRHLFFMLGLNPKQDFFSRDLRI
jgi:hypothetical protein